MALGIKSRTSTTFLVASIGIGTLQEAERVVQAAARLQIRGEGLDLFARLQGRVQTILDGVRRTNLSDQSITRLLGFSQFGIVSPETWADIDRLEIRGTGRHPQSDHAVLFADGTVMRDRRPSPSLLGLLLSAANDDPALRQSLYRAMERLHEGSLLPSEMEEGEFGTFVDFLHERLAALPSEGRPFFLRDLTQHLEALWREYRSTRPTPAPTRLNQPPTRQTSGVRHESHLSKALDWAALEPLLRKRRGEGPDQRLDTSTQQGRIAMRARVDASMGAAGLGALSTIPFRYAPFWRWLRERSPLAGRRDLTVVGAGIGVMPIAGIRRGSHELAIAEPLEALGLFASDPAGRVFYLDIKPEPVGVIRKFRASGKMLTAKLRGSNSMEAHMRQMMDSPIAAAMFAAAGASQEVSAAILQMKMRPEEIPWAVGEVERGGVRLLHFDAGIRAERPTTEMQFPLEMAQRLEARQGDLVLDDLPWGTADLAPALTTFLYIPPPLHNLALLRWAGVPRPGGLLALTRDTDETARPFLQILGYRLLDSIETVEPTKIVDVYQRPEASSAALLDELLARAREFLSRIG